MHRMNRRALRLVVAFFVFGTHASALRADRSRSMQDARGATASSPSQPRPITIASAPVLRITEELVGGSSSPLSSVTAVAWIPGGAIAVGTARPPAIHLCDARGRYLRGVGRRGSGPGEYQMITWMKTCGTDSLFVYDGNSKRLSVFSSDGKFARQVMPTLRDGRFPSMLDCNRASSFMYRGWFDGEIPVSNSGPHRSTIRIALMDRGGRETRLIGVFPSEDRYSFQRSDGPRPLGRQTFVALGSRHAFIAAADAYEIFAFPLDTARADTIRVSHTPRKVTADIRSEYVRSVLDRAPNENVRRRVAESLRSLQFPDVLPPYASMVVDALDQVWVQDYPMGQKVNTWRVFDVGMRTHRITQMPFGFRPYEIASDLVLGVSVDADGAESIEIRKLSR